jgi:two-component sensor histidine kinase
LRLTTRLIALVGMALLPALVIQAYNELALRRSRQDAVREQALSSARGAALDLGRFVEGLRQVLVAVAATPAIRDKDPARCTEYLKEVARSYPAYMLLAVNDVEGNTICNSSGSPPGTFANADRAYFQRAMATNAFAVGDQVIGFVTNKRSLHFALPFQDTAGPRGGVVLVSLDLDWLTSHLLSGPLPRDASLTILDRPGTVLVQVPDDGRWAGKAPLAGFRAALAGSMDAVLERPGLDGHSRVFGVVHPGGPLAGFTVAIGLSHAAAFADINAATTRGIVLIGLGALLAVFAAWIAGRELIRKPISALVAASERWRQGDWTARTDLVNGSSELHRLGVSFDQMADGLAQRETERQESLARERLLVMEVDHRAKNALTVAQSLVRLTRAETIQDYIAKVQGRIAALARGHRLLADNHWEGADLREILIDELAPFGGRIHVQGPPVRLLASAVQPVCLILHELAANAVNHGALSVEEGRVEAHWSRASEVDGLRIRWCEMGGPPVTAPAAPEKKGLGSRLIKGTAVDQLGAEIDVEWAVAGLCMTMTLPPGSFSLAPEGALTADTGSVRAAG